MFFTDLKQKMRSWSLEDLVRTVENPKRNAKRVNYALSIIAERKTPSEELKAIAQTLIETKFQQYFESRAAFYQDLELPKSKYLEESEVLNIYTQALEAYQEKSSSMTLGLDNYIG